MEVLNISISSILSASVENFLREFNAEVGSADRFALFKDRFYRLEGSSARPIFAVSNKNK